MMRSVLLLVFLVLPLGAQESVPPLRIAYVVDVTDPKGGQIVVDMTIENNRHREITLGLPVWRPGSYRLQQYRKALQFPFEAKADGRSIDVKETGHQSVWTISPGAATTVSIRYKMRPRDVASLTINLTEKHYFLEGPSLYFHAKEAMNAPHRVRFKLPSGWRVASGLKPTGDDEHEARDYDTFIDCPTELGTFDLHKFVHDGVTFELAVHAEGKVDAERLVEVHRKIVAEHGKMFGGFPFDRYVFLYHFRPQAGGGGLEHLNSTDISMPLGYIQSDAYNIASIASHEFIHLWNVKRIRPKVLGPFDYTKEVRTRALWLCEGGTSYFGDRALPRCGVWTESTYFSHLVGEISQLQGNVARKTQSAEESSWTIWDRRMTDSTPRVDYYNKGELLCLLLDLSIRVQTGNAKSLDDVMRHLYETCVTGPAKDGKGPIGVGYEEDGILKAVNHVSGKDFTEFFRKYVAGTEELPYEAVLGAAGLKLAVAKVPALGLTMNGLRVRQVPAGGAAEKAGVKANDRLVELDGTEVSSRDQMVEILARHKGGDKVKAVLMRGEDRVEVELTLQERETGEYRLTRAADPTDLQKKVVDGWVGRKSY